VYRDGSSVSPASYVGGRADEMTLASWRLGASSRSPVAQAGTPMQHSLIGRRVRALWRVIRPPTKTSTEGGWPHAATIASTTRPCGAVRVMGGLRGTVRAGETLNRNPTRCEAGDAPGVQLTHDELTPAPSPCALEPLARPRGQ
jgi:hypothetical protein